MSSCCHHALKGKHDVSEHDNDVLESDAILVFAAVVLNVSQRRQSTRFNIQERVDDVNNAIAGLDVRS